MSYELLKNIDIKKLRISLFPNGSSRNSSLNKRQQRNIEIEFSIFDVISLIKIREPDFHFSEDIKKQKKIN